MNWLYFRISLYRKQEVSYTNQLDELEGVIVLGIRLLLLHCSKLLQYVIQYSKDVIHHSVLQYDNHTVRFTLLVTLRKRLKRRQL